jgi:hypothetical protein
MPRYSSNRYGVFILSRDSRSKPESHYKLSHICR